LPAAVDGWWEFAFGWVECVADLVFDYAAFVFDAGYVHFGVADLLQAAFFGFEFCGGYGFLVFEAGEVVA